MDNFALSTTGYAGYEEEITTMRNANRSIAQPRRYLDWRYAGVPDAPQPLVFWLRTALGTAVGMAAVIFRPYWVRNRRVHIGVVGDISLDAGLRGAGLGRKLLMDVKQHLRQFRPDLPALVIPNEAAGKSLHAAGWELGGTFIPFVLPVAPVERLTAMFRSRSMALASAKMLKAGLGILAGFHVKHGYEMRDADSPDETFSALWQSLPKENLVLGDRSADTLVWRYVNHPHEKFRIATMMAKKELTGYLVYSVSGSDGCCFIYDMLVNDKNNFQCMLALFVRKMIRRGDVFAIRLVLSDRHPYAACLRGTGFIKRKEQGIFQVSLPPQGGEFSSLQWALMLGDKDV